MKLIGIAVDSLQTYLFRFSNLTINFLIGVLAARFLGPTGKGCLVLAFLVNNIYLYLFGNLDGAITYRISRLNEPPRLVLNTAIIYSLSIGFLTVIGVWLYTRFHPPFFPEYMWVIILNAPLALLLTNFHGVFLGLNRVTAVNWYTFCPNFFWLILLIPGFFLIKTGVTGTLVCWIIAQLLLLVWCFMTTVEYWGPPYHDIFAKQLLKKMLSFGWPLGLVNLITFLNYRIDMFLVLHFLGTARLGLYSVAVSGAEMLWFTSTAVITAIYARVGMAEKEQAAHLTAKAVRHTFFLNLGLGVLIWFAVEAFLPIVYGEIYRPSLAPFRVLLPGVLAYGLVNIFAAYFTNQLGKPRVTLLVALISTFINLGISMILIPRVGMIGGAWATTGSYLISLVIVGILFYQRTGLGLKHFCFTSSDWNDYRLLLIRYLKKR